MLEGMSYAEMLDTLSVTDSRKEFREKENRLLNRISEILNIVRPGHTGWYFEGADEGQTGPILDNINGDGCITNLIIYGSGVGRHLPGIDIPRRWLDMSNEEIFKEIREEERKAKEEKEAIAARAKEARAKKQALIDQALARLTEEECRALGYAKPRFQKDVTP